MHEIIVIFTVILTVFITTRESLTVQLDKNRPKVTSPFKYRPTTVKPDEICMPQLGCFDMGGDFVNYKVRPVQFQFQTRKEINTTFKLFTRANPNYPIFIDANDKTGIIKSGFNAGRKTKFFIHGFLEFFVVKPSWFMKLTHLFLEKDDYNIIHVRWKGGNRFPYTRATANSRIVGAEIGFLFQVIKDIWPELRAEDWHIIGHSLGAQAAGYAGKRIAGLGRITGLDPAQPYFQGMPASVRLDRADARFVDIIHTDIRDFYTGFGFGIKDPIGTIDFYPNGGSNNPGCHWFWEGNLLEQLKRGNYKLSDRLTFFNEGIEVGMRTLVACNHMRSIFFFIESLKSNDLCSKVSYPCSSWSAFNDGLCYTCNADSNGNCPVMGVNADKANIDYSATNVYYLRISNTTCHTYYHVRIKLDSRYLGKISGGFDINFMDENYQQVNLQDTVKVKQSWSTRNFNNLLADGPAIKKITSIRLLWLPDDKQKQLPAEKILIESVRVKPMHDPRANFNYKFCNINSKESEFTNNRFAAIDLNLCPDQSR